MRRENVIGIALLLRIAYHCCYELHYIPTPRVVVEVGDVRGSAGVSMPISMSKTALSML